MKRIYRIFAIMAAVIALTVTVTAAPPADRRKQKQEQNTPKPIKPKPNNSGGSSNSGKRKKDNTNRQSTSVSSPAATASGNQTFTVNGVSFVMVPVSGGTFSMGSNNGDSDEKPVHSVTLSGYMIGETEVTQALWKAVMGSTRVIIRATTSLLRG